MNFKLIFPLLAALMWMTASCGGDSSSDDSSGTTSTAATSDCKVTYFSLSSTYKSHDMVNIGQFINQNNCTYTYNAEGFRTESVCEMDTASDGVVDIRSTSLFSSLTAQGDPQVEDSTYLRIVDNFDLGTGAATHSYTYNAADKQLIKEDISNGDRTITTNIYDVNNNLLTEQVEQDLTNNSVIDSTSTVTSTYNASNLRTSITETDGATYIIIGTISYNAYHANGLPTEFVFTVDQMDINSVPMGPTVYMQTVLTYDANAQVTSETNSMYADDLLTLKTYGYESSNTWSACRAGIGIAKTSNGVATAQDIQISRDRINQMIPIRR